MSPHSSITPADKKLFYTFLDDVNRVVLKLRDALEASKDKELRSFYRQLAEDLEFVSADMADTVQRL